MMTSQTPKEQSKTMTMPTITVPERGDPAPDCTLLDKQGQPIVLSTYWTQRMSVFVFLRHFACPHCRAQVSELAEATQAVEAAGLGVVLIGLGKPDKAQRFKDEMGTLFPVLCDPQKASYAAYGLQAMNIFRQTTPREITALLADRSKAGGTIISLQEDMMQLGGTFVIDCSGTIRFAHRGIRIGERPTIAALLDAAASPLDDDQADHRVA